MRSESIVMPDSIEALRGDSFDRDAEEDGKTSFTLLIQQHQAKLYSFIYRYTRNRQDAEDLTQDTFVKAFKNFHRYDSKYAFASWLYTIGRRTVHNHYRSAKRTEPMEFDIADESVRPDGAAENSDTKNSVWETVKRLKKEHQEVLILKYIEDLSIIEIGQVLGKSQSNIKILLFRARNQLKKIHKQ